MKRDDPSPDNSSPSAAQPIVARRRGWAPLIKGSVGLHAGAALGLALQPESWPWALGLLAADHAVLTAAGLWPRSKLLGPNWTRLPTPAVARGEIAITIDDGPDPEVTPGVLELLDRHSASATFFCIGERAQCHAALCSKIVRAGHAIENHSQHHRHNFSLLGPRGLLREIEAAQRSLTEITGRAPRFFRAPAGLRNPFLDPVLAKLDLQLASWTRRGFDTRVGDATAVSARLLNGLAAGDILLLHDGHAARGIDGRPVILDALASVLAAIHRAGLRPVTLLSALDPA